MKTLRSMLFIPGHSREKLAKGDTSGADALVLDLEDAVVPESKPVARERIAAYLTERPRGRRSSELWVRINPLDSGLALQDLSAVIPGAPDGIMAPKVNGPADLLRLSHYLDALEAQAGVEPGSVKILPVATETAIAPFRLGDYAGAGCERLMGLTWGAEDLSTAVGANTNLGADGKWALTYQIVRSMTLLGAHAAGVQAIETLYTDFRDEAGLRESCRAALAEGFTGRIAIHPAQVAPINESFSPSEESVARAHIILAAFAASPGAGAVQIEGKMFDIPHLKQAQGVLARAAELQGT